MAKHRAHWIVGGFAALCLVGCATVPPEETAEEGVDEIIVTGSSGSESAADAGPPPPPPAPVVSAPSRVMDSDVSAPRGSRSLSTAPEPAPSVEGTITERPELPQSGQLTAGDYDDVLNPELYESYIEKKLQTELGRKDLPFVDAADRIEIKVQDRLGKPVPLARVSLTTAQGEPMFPLRTGADGKAYLYPNYDALEDGMTVQVSANGAQALRQKLSSQMLDSGGTLSFDLGFDRSPVSKLDLLLTLDATGSMNDEMTYLQAELTAILSRMARDNSDLDIRAGLIVYRDTRDDYVLRDFGLTRDLAAFKANLGDQSAQGGGDMPEAMDQALSKGLEFEWRPDAVKINLLVADAPPHDRDIAATWDSALISRSRGIHIVPLAASGVDATAEFLMRSMGQLTGGRYLFLTDDSGIGNPHAEPTVDCYVVTYLDRLVQRVFESLVSGRRVEPEGDDVIRSVGNYREGLCKIEDTPTG